MTPDRWEQVNKVFQAAVQMEPSERAKFLVDACSDDHELRREVDSLLLFDQVQWPMIETNALEVATPLLADDRPQLLTNQQFGDYLIIDLIGKGGMGEVYLAKDENLSRMIALKLLPIEFTKDKDRLQRFQQEARAASALNHPNILTIHQLGEIEGQQYIATEYVDGETLRQRMNRGELTIDEALNISIQIAGALSSAHAAGIVHRDIKPENLMLRRDGYVKIVDFGLAKLAEQYERTPDPQAVSHIDLSSELVMGTVKYMSPEQARGLRVDPRSDIFSLGVVLYEMLTGQLPFTGENSKEVLTAIVKQKPVPLSQRTELPLELEQILNKALAKQPTERYATMSELLDELARVRRNLELEQTSDPHRLVGPASMKSNIEVLPAQSITSQVVSLVVQNKLRSGMTLLGALVVGGAIFITARTPWNRSASIVNLKASQPVTVETLPTRGEATGTAIAATGGLIAYSISDRGQSSLWLLQTKTQQSSQLTVPEVDELWGIVFSPDGRYLYYNRGSFQRTALYRIRVPEGGEPEKILDGVDSPVALSPDGTQLSYISNYSGEGESLLVVGSIDGKTQRRIASRKEPLYFQFLAGPAWSPDGKTIAVIVEGGSTNNSSLSSFTVTDGTERKIIAPNEWRNYRDFDWLPDGSGFVIAVRTESPTAPAQLWELSYPGGQVTRITNDTNHYESISVARASDQMVAVVRQLNSDIWVIPNIEQPFDARQTTFSTKEGRWGVCWAKERIIFHSLSSGTDDLWLMNADGSDPRNLTPTEHLNFFPSVSLDGEQVVFMSVRTGSMHIWRMNLEGNGQLQLTSGRDEQFPQVSADGKWAYYTSWDTGLGTLWKVSTSGGQAEQAIAESSMYPTTSPNGASLTYVHIDNEAKNTLRRVVSIDGGPAKYSFGGALAALRLAHWTPKGDSLVYLDDKSGVDNVWLQPLGGGSSKQLTHFTEGKIFSFDLSRDGKALVLSRGSVVQDAVLVRGYR